MAVTSLRPVLASVALAALAGCAPPERVPGLFGPGAPPEAESIAIEQEDPPGVPEDDPESLAPVAAPGVYGLASMHRDLELYAAGGEPGVDAPLERTSGDRGGRYAFKLEAGDYRLCSIQPVALFEQIAPECVDVVLDDGEAVRWDVCNVSSGEAGPPTWGLCAPEGPLAAPAEPACPQGPGVCGQLVARYDDYPALDGAIHEDDRIWPGDNGVPASPAVLATDGAFAAELSPGLQTFCFLEAIGGPFSCATIDVPADRAARVDVCVGDCERWTGEDIVDVTMP
jgi:hypothetical protein